MALAHVIENKVEAAYRRGDLFAKRREMMQAWADYLDELKTGDAAICIEDEPGPPRARVSGAPRNKRRLRL